MNSVFCWLLATWKTVPSLGLGVEAVPLELSARFTLVWGVRSFLRGFLGRRGGCCDPGPLGTTPSRCKAARCFIVLDFRELWGDQSQLGGPFPWFAGSQ